LADEIKEGAVVVLKSGGPAMTVTSVGDHYGTLSAWCVWFDGKKQVNGTFNVLTLKLDE
jgi:uncharacterized protein YodC (DUF2158 family)